MQQFAHCLEKERDYTDKREHECEGGMRNFARRIGERESIILPVI